MTKVAEFQPTEAQAKAAHEVHAAIVGEVKLIRTAWVRLAQRLWDFTEQRMWAALGYTSFEQWLASPEVELSRRHCYYLNEVWRELVIKRGLDPSELHDVGVSKITEILPAVRRGYVELDQAIADAKVLGRDDLREKYAKATPQRPVNGTLDASTEPEYAICNACGSRYQVKT